MQRPPVQHESDLAGCELMTDSPKHHEYLDRGVDYVLLIGGAEIECHGNRAVIALPYPSDRCRRYSAQMCLDTNAENHLRPESLLVDDIHHRHDRTNALDLLDRELGDRKVQRSHPMCRYSNCLD